MKIVLDSSILLSIFSRDTLYESSKSLLIKYHNQQFIINSFIFLEVRMFFSSDDELLRKLQKLDVEYEKNYIPNSSFIIPKWRTYLKNKQYFCPVCGRETTPICSHCNSDLRFRQRILSDFFIADFAFQNGGQLLTHDRGFFRNYFSEITILE